jgi:hypothetical protein
MLVSDRRHHFTCPARSARNLIEPMFCCLKDFPKDCNAYDKRVDIYLLSAILLAAAITW